MIALNTAFDAFYRTLCFLLGEFLPTLQLLYGHYCRQKFVVKIKYAEQHVAVRGRTSDIRVFYEVFALRIYKIPEKEVATIIDIGANVGYASIYFAHFYPNARIIALEPEHSNYQMLLENTQNYKNILCIQAAIWPEETELTLQNPQASNWSFRFAEDTTSGLPIKSQTLSGLMKKFHLKRINLLKIDIEGGEEALFAYDTDWLRFVDCLQIEIHSEEARKLVFNALANYRYSSYDAFSNYYILMNHVSE